MSNIHGPFYFKGIHKGDEWTYEFTINFDTRHVNAKLYPSNVSGGWFHKLKEKIKKMWKNENDEG